MIIMAAMAFVFTSCGNNNTGTNNAGQAQEAPAALEIDQVLASADTLANQEITMEGICTHTCKHGATKIFMMGSDDTKTIRVEAAGLGSFDQKCINNIVRVKGILREERVDEGISPALGSIGGRLHGRAAWRRRGRMRHREGCTWRDGQHRGGAHCRLPPEDCRTQGGHWQGLSLLLLRGGIGL